MTMQKEGRYIVWRHPTQQFGRVSVPDLLSRFPTVKVLKSKDPHHAVVLMDVGAEKKIRRLLPDLSIEEDRQHRLVSSY